MSDLAEPHSSVSLRADHRRLDEAFAQLCEAARLGTWHEVDELWPSFSAQLEHHMRHEELALFPIFAKTPEGQDRVAELEAEHAALRRLVEALGVEVQLHALRAETVDHLVASLRAHAAGEEQIFYPWLARFELARAAVDPA